MHDEEGILMKAIAEAHGRGLKVPVVSIKPEDAEAHSGWLANIVKLDVPSSSVITRQKLNWKPTGPELIADLDNNNALSLTSRPACVNRF